MRRLRSIPGLHELSSGQWIGLPIGEIGFCATDQEYNRQHHRPDSTRIPYHPGNCTNKRDTQSQSARKIGTANKIEGATARCARDTATPHYFRPTLLFKLTATDQFRQIQEHILKPCSACAHAQHGSRLGPAVIST